MPRYGMLSVVAALIAGQVAEVSAQGPSLQQVSSNASESETTFDWSMEASLSAGEKRSEDVWALNEKHALTGSLTLKHKLRSGWYGSLNGQIAVSPGILQATDLQGALAAGEVRLGRAFSLGRSDIIDDTADIFASYQTRGGFEIINGVREYYDDDVLTVGAEFEDVRSIICYTTPNSDKCSRPRRGWRWKVKAGFSLVDSDQQRRDRSAITASGEVGIPVRLFFPLNVRGSYERSRYEHLPGDGDPHRIDHTGSAFVGIDVTHLFAPSVPQLSQVTFGVQYSRTFSNVDAKDSDGIVGQLNVRFGSRQRAFKPR